jgi:hypothetical protein
LELQECDREEPKLAFREASTKARLREGGRRGAARRDVPGKEGMRRLRP